MTRVDGIALGRPYHPMPQLAGSAISWQNTTLRDTTAFAAELPAGKLDAATSPRTAGSTATAAA